MINPYPCAGYVMGQVGSVFFFQIATLLCLYTDIACFTTKLEWQFKFWTAIVGPNLVKDS